MASTGIKFINDFFNDLESGGSKKTYGDYNPYGRARILHKVRNGKGWLWYCQDTKTYWRSLKSCRKLSPASQRVKNPKHTVRTQRG